MKSKKIILIMGLPGSGKTTLAEKLSKKLSAEWLNADKIRGNITIGILAMMESLDKLSE